MVYELKNSVEEIKNAIKDFKIRGFKLKSSKK
jgi:hypothetical protein